MGHMKGGEHRRHAHKSIASALVSILRLIMHVMFHAIFILTYCIHIQPINHKHGTKEMTDLGPSSF